MDALSQTAVKVDPTPIKVDPVKVDDTAWGYLSFFLADAEGCTVRFAIEQKWYHLAVTQPNYNSLFSLLLGCWLNHYRVSLKYRLPLQGQLAQADPNAPITYSMVSIDALNVTSQQLGG